MKYSNWIKKLFLLVLFFVLLLGLINYIVDPFQQYRVETFYKKSYESHDARYRNGGFAKHFEYDSVILGTSMTENFTLSKVEKILNFKKVLKLSISGGTAKEQSITLQNAINNKTIKNVLWGLDTFSFIGNPERLMFGKGSFPFYLYDKNFFNDYQYLLSLKVLKESFHILFEYLFQKNKKPILDYNHMYQWQYKSNENFTLQEVQKHWKKRKESFNKHSMKEYTFNKMKINFDTNFGSLIKKYPKIKFTIFFPPYSILTFKSLEEKRLFYEMLKFKKYIIEQLLNLENVDIYDFQIAKNITHNPKYYQDLTHYHKKISRWILHKISKKNYKITKKNMELYLKILQEQTTKCRPNMLLKLKEE